MKITRRQGPATNLTLTPSNQLINGTQTTREWGPGSLLIIATANISNGDSATRQINLRLQRDGINQGAAAQLAIPISPDTVSDVIQRTWLRPAAPGIHTYQLVISSTNGVNVQVVNGGAELIVIELPEWDDTDQLQ